MENKDFNSLDCFSTKDKLSILNIGAGKLKPLRMNSTKVFLLNLDSMYTSRDDQEDIEFKHRQWIESEGPSIEKYCNSDAFEFLHSYLCNFDRISIYRYLEHIEFTQIPYFIYLLSTVVKIGGVVDVIVPNYKLLGKMLLDEKVFMNANFEADNILLTTELLNEPNCPHASVWTVDRAHYFFHLEKRFKILMYDENFEFDGRNIYLRFVAERI